LLRLASGLFIILHGLVYLWYVTLARNLVEYEPRMGWSGHSWLLTGMIGDGATRSLAAVLFVVAAIAFVAGGLGIFIGSSWWRPVVMGAAVYGSVIAIVFWDGGTGKLVEKGLLGLVINIAIVSVMLGHD